MCVCVCVARNRFYSKISHYHIHLLFIIKNKKKQFNEIGFLLVVNCYSFFLFSLSLTSYLALQGKMGNSKITTLNITQFAIDPINVISNQPPNFTQNCKEPYFINILHIEIFNTNIFNLERVFFFLGKLGAF